MSKAGFIEVLAGVESGSERILRYHLKGSSPEINTEAMRIIGMSGMKYKALTMLGHPGETLDDINLAKKWLLNAAKEYEKICGWGKFSFDLSLFQPFPGSPIWNKSKKNFDKFSDKFKWVYSTNRGEENNKICGPSKIYFNKIDFSNAPTFYKGKPGEYIVNIRTEEVSSEEFANLRDKIEKEVRGEIGLKSLI